MTGDFDRLPFDFPPARAIIDNDEWAGYKDVTLRFVVIFDDEGNYIIHGQSNEDAEKMFKTVAPLWNFDPKKELAQFMEVEAKLPCVARINKPYVANDK